MRHIGHLPGGKARVFSDFLVSRGIRNEVERENDGSYSIWIHDEDQVAQAQGLLTRFAGDSNAAEFIQAGEAAEKVRASQKLEQEAYRRRIHTRKSVFPKMGGYGVGILTYALIVISVIMFVYTKFGTDQDACRPFLISDPELSQGGLPEVSAGQFWRLFTPIFLHFGPIHIIFNMMWLYQLGCMIEARRGSLQLLGIISFVALISNVAQFMVTRHAAFGGMSGVVYGLAGYVWIRGKIDRSSGLFLDRQSSIILLVWLVICYMGWIPNVANTAHLAGLIAGLICGASIFLFPRKTPE
jgi:GlpG protein